MARTIHSLRKASAQLAELVSFAMRKACRIKSPTAHKVSTVYKEAQREFHALKVPTIMSGMLKVSPSVSLAKPVSTAASRDLSSQKVIATWDIIANKVLSHQILAQTMLLVILDHVLKDSIAQLLHGIPFLAQQVHIRTQNCYNL